MTTAAPIAPEHPGTFITEELEAREWAQADLAYILGWDVAQLNRLIKGKTSLTPEAAVSLGEAFDVAPEFFLNLQKLYDLARAKQPDPGVKLRASWASVFPVREMIKRGWIEEGDSALLELQMVRFFGKSDRGSVPFVGNASVYPHAAKKQSYDSVTPAQYAWVHRVKRVAETIPCPEYSESELRSSLESLRAHFLDKDDLKHIQHLLLRCGVRLVLVEHLPGTKIDGVCVWLDGDQPAIGISNRLDRLDNFCFVLRHEIEHVLRGDGKEATFAPVDEDVAAIAIEGNEIPEEELVANIEAAEFCIPQDMLGSFISRKAPYISEKDVLMLSRRAQIDPAVVVGQIQRKLDKYGWLRKFQKSIRPYLLQWERVDGWDHIAEVDL